MYDVALIIIKTHTIHARTVLLGLLCCPWLWWLPDTRLRSDYWYKKKGLQLLPSEEVKTVLLIY